MTRPDSTSKFPDGVPVVKADYSDVSSLKAAMTGQDVVIAMATPRASGGQHLFIDAAIVADLTRAGALGNRGIADSRPHGLLNDKIELPKDDLDQILRAALREGPKGFQFPIDPPMPAQ
ncbi:hypothetical protein BU23DRAFT_564429 [Bimuria novae-zelandiae CBS 107.79]|uniref:NAD(P)-binding domain-containing protein n=1 Tax=Bimuria novae-zelandiae CBS 107.79 TaxID=1447943 RepID=A0A6A5VNT8_9PLEO|nr:hypothetical protein BU23DRAFT_564429 [Bimuria novae-zelandiae CBS 107.79]